MRLGIVVNPDAGLGGKLGFNGSDGRAAEARAAGAEDRAGPRMEQCLLHLGSLLSSSLNRTDVTLTLVGWTGRMGSTWADSVVNQGHVLGDWIGDTPGQTTPNDTNDLVVQLMAAGVDGILYAGVTAQHVTLFMHSKPAVKRLKNGAHRRAGRRENAFRMLRHHAKGSG